MGRKAGGHNKPKDAAGAPIVGKPKDVIEVTKRADEYQCGACGKIFGEKFPKCPYCGQALQWA